MPSVRNNSEGKIYLSVSFGKLRQKTLENGNKVDENTPNAVLRETESGQKSWAIEYDSVKGIIEGINLKSHEEYGDFFELLIREPGDLCCLTFKVESIAFQQIMNLLPNVDFSNTVEISTYSYVNKAGRNISGLNVIQNDNPKTKEITFKNGNKINTIVPYYKEWKDDKWIYNNGYPDANNVDFTDKRQRTLYNLDLESFLKSEIPKLFEGKISKDKEVKEQNNEPVSDLPFDNNMEDLPY